MNVVTHSKLFLTIFLSVIAIPASAQAIDTCREESSFNSCSLTATQHCRNLPEGCTGEEIPRCIQGLVNSCLQERTANAVYFVKYNTAGADFNFLEIANISTEKELVGAFRIFNIEGSNVGDPVEFKINPRGRSDFDIHSVVGPQVFGQIEISIYSEDDTALSYMSFYNQREQATAQGVFLDQTISVKAEKSSN